MRGRIQPEIPGAKVPEQDCSVVMRDLWCLGTRCACNNNLSGKRSRLLPVWILSVQLCLQQSAYIDQNNRAEKDQSKTVKNGHWCGWMDMDEAVNSSTGFWLGCLYPETDVTMNPSLRGKRMCMIPTNKKTVSLFFLGSIDHATSESFPSQPTCGL